MAKKQKGAAPSFPVSTSYTPPTQIRLTKAQAGNFSIGDKVKISVSGKVVGIRQNKSWNGNTGKDEVVGYEVELEDSSVVDIETNPAAKSLKEMKGA